MHLEALRIRDFPAEETYLLLIIISLISFSVDLVPEKKDGVEKMTRFP